MGPEFEKRGAVGMKSRWLASLSVIAMATTGGTAFAQSASQTNNSEDIVVTAQKRADYERAAKIQDFSNLVSRLSLTPNWIGRTGRFWYLDSHEGRKTFMAVDPVKNAQAPAFDHVRLAKGLSRAADVSFVADKLPFDRFGYVGNGSAILFTVAEAGWRCALTDYSCVSVPAPFRKGDTISPDGRRAIFLRDDNLWIREVETGKERALTSDGTRYNSYVPNHIEEYVTREMLGWPSVPDVNFSPDSTKILAWRTDVRKVQLRSVTETVMGGAPKVHFFPFTNAGDVEIPQGSPILIDLERGTTVAVKSPPIGQHEFNETIICWNPGSTKFCFNEESRGYKTASLHVADTATGTISTPVVETSQTYVDRGYDARLVGEDVVWISERDGWKHLYRIDGRTGKVRNQITKGEWVVREIVHTDEASRRVYFTAGGQAPGEDPYQRILYRIGLDGTGLQRLTPEDGDHQISFSPDGRYFIDTWSRIDLAPISVLRAADGRLVRELQRADIAKLVATGWKPPERFTVKAADGKTDIYGAIFRPSNFDPAKRYPVLDAIYPGPQSIRTRKEFAVRFSEFNEFPMAEIGFIVVTIDGRGTPFRSKAFHEFSFGNMGSAGALEDHVAGLKQLAASRPEMDLDRVGIYGHSGGGYASARAMLDYPDFYKVAVSSAGNHDQRGYFSGWGERFQGYPVGDGYLSQANPPLAGKLKGKLLLVHGSMDDNVSPDLTMQMANALIAADKDFDMLILPNRNHLMVDLGKGTAALPSYDPYFIRRRWDYFVQNLLGVTPPADFHLTQTRDEDKAKP